MRAEDPVAGYPALHAGAREAALFEGQRRVLSLLSRGALLADTLEALCLVIEERLPDAMCSVLLFDPAAQTLHHAAAPRLPKAYCQAIDGVRIGPAVGSCGTAAFLRIAVSVEDVTSDPRWAAYKDLATGAGLFACCSIPIQDARGLVLGTFAIYHQQPGAFAKRDVELLRAMTELATVVIEGDLRRSALKESEERFRNIAAQTGQVIYDVEPKRAKAVWSGAIDELFGEVPSDFTSASFDALLARVHPEDRDRVTAEMHHGGLGEARRTLSLEYRVQRSDGSYTQVVQRGITLCGPDGHAVRHYGVLADVTEQRRTEAALWQTQKRDSLGLLAGGVAHDFNNLLSAMLGNLELARMTLDAQSPARIHLEDLEVAIERAAVLTRQMLAYSGKGQFVVRPIEVSETVREVATILSAGLSKKLTLKLELSQEATTVEADVAQLQQVVLNLASNAAEAVGDAAGTLTITTRVEELDAAELTHACAAPQLDPGRYVVLEVSDTGCGMTREVAARIYDPFFSTKGAGRGLGLAAIAGILRMHRAAIELRTEVGQGSTFTVRFPISERKVEPRRAPAVVAPKVSPRRTVLFVDDEAALRRIAQQVFSQQGLHVLDAADGIEAVEMVRKNLGRLDLVIMDLTMPRMGGREALSLIQELAPSLPVILCSGYDQASSLDQLHGPKPAAFVQKPYLLCDLAADVRKILGD